MLEAAQHSYEVGPFLDLRVATIHWETDDIRSFDLVDPRGGKLPAFTPGAHVDVRLQTGVLRQYSLCGSCRDRTKYRIAVKREPKSRGGSEYLHQSVRCGDILRIGRPRNAFPLDLSAGYHLFLAGGIGITPIIGMVEDLTIRGRGFELDLFVRSSEHVPFRQLIEQPQIRDRVRILPGLSPDDVGRWIDARLSSGAPDAHLYVCGPPGFVDVVRNATRTWPPGSIHIEAFGAAPSLAGSGEAAFEVHLARRGLSLVVPPSKSILDVFREHDLAIEASCEQGICGTCMTRVIEGVPDHRDQFLSKNQKDEGGVMMVCVSRAKSSRLVLDL